MITINRLILRIQQNFEYNPLETISAIAFWIGVVLLFICGTIAAFTYLECLIALTVVSAALCFLGFMINQAVT